MTSEQTKPAPSPLSIHHGKGAEGGGGYYKLIKTVSKKPDYHENLTIFSQ